MNFLLAAICIGFLAWAAFQHFRRQPVAGSQARFLFIRAWAFTALVSFMFLLAFLFLPNKGRVVLLLPVFLFGATLAKWIARSRDRLRRESQTQSNFERAKRIN